MTALIFFGPPIAAFLFFILMDISNFKWVHLKLRRPSRMFVKGKAFTHEEYELSKTNSDFFRYYRQHSLESLQNLEKEIAIKSPRYVENSQLSKYLISIVTIFGLTIASYATVSSFTNSDQTITLAFFTSILVTVLIAYFIADLAI